MNTHLSTFRPEVTPLALLWCVLCVCPSRARAQSWQPLPAPVASPLHLTAIDGQLLVVGSARLMGLRADGQWMAWPRPIPAGWVLDPDPGAPLPADVPLDRVEAWLDALSVQCGEAPSQMCRLEAARAAVEPGGGLAVAFALGGAHSALVNVGGAWAIIDPDGVRWLEGLPEAASVEWLDGLWAEGAWWLAGSRGIWRVDPVGLATRVASAARSVAVGPKAIWRLSGRALVRHPLRRGHAGPGEVVQRVKAEPTVRLIHGQPQLFQARGLLAARRWSSEEKPDAAELIESGAQRRWVLQSQRARPLDPDRGPTLHLPEAVRSLTVIHGRPWALGVEGLWTSGGPAHVAQDDLDSTMPIPSAVWPEPGCAQHRARVARWRRARWLPDVVASMTQWRRDRSVAVAGQSPLEQVEGLGWAISLAWRWPLNERLQPQPCAEGLDAMLIGGVGP